MFSILNKQENLHKTPLEPPTENPQPEKAVFFLDLNLDQIIDKVVDDWGEDIGELYDTLPADRGTEDYRRAVFADVKGEGVLEILIEFLGKMKERAFCIEQEEKVEDDLQQNVWYLRETASYVDALDILREKLGAFSFQSEGMKGLLAFLEQCVSDPEYRAFREEVLRLRDELVSFRVLLTYEKERFTVSEGTGKGDYADFLDERFPGTDRVFKSPFVTAADASELERETIRVFRKKHKDFFDAVGRFAKKYKSYARDEVLLLQREMVYYAAYLKFMRKMQEKGMEFCAPDVSGDRLSATGLYDLALALVKQEKGEEVVVNDADLWPEESFFVLTGPNQGGKTTFARSLGQLVYFTKMGLDVPAKAATVPYYKEILTHFSVEESAESGRGKLMDELMRLKPMMGDERAGTFVVINELFTTAANYDACIMGKKVLEYFVSQNCKGIYVTHLNELTKADASVVSLRAEVDEDQVQTYRILRSEAQELAGANRQAEKYGLTYQQIKERFS